MAELEGAFELYKQEYHRPELTDEENAKRFQTFVSTMSMVDEKDAAAEFVADGVGSNDSAPQSSHSLSGTMQNIESRQAAAALTRSFAGLGVETAATRGAAAADSGDNDAGDGGSETMSKSFLERRRGMFEKLVEQYPTKVGKRVSQRDRERMVDPPATLTYGEIDFDSFGAALAKIKCMYGLPGVGTTPPGGIMQSPGGVFYDIGSGTGKPSIAAAFLHPFARVGGVEILPGLHAASLELAAAFRTAGRAALARDCAARDDQGLAAAAHHDTDISFTLGDGFDLGVLDWSDGDVVFANSTCFSDSLMARFALACERLKKGALVITFTKRLPSGNFTVLDGKVYPMSWGGATVYIQQKLTDPTPGI